MKRIPQLKNRLHLRSLKKTENIVIFALSVAAIVLLYFIYQKFAPTFNTSTQQEQTTLKPATQRPTTVDASFESDRPDYLTPEEKEAMDTPNQGDSEEIKRAFQGKVEKAAKDADTIDIANCQPRPPIAKMKQNATFTFKNSDTTDHIVAFSQEKSYTVKKNSSVTVTADFLQGPGIFGFGCDQSPTEVGLILTTAQ